MSGEELRYTIEDIYNLPGTQRAELINGQLYLMEVPPTIHQHILMELLIRICNYIEKQQKDNVEVISRVPVFLNVDENDALLDPDIIIVSDRSKFDERGCNGAPDWVIEVVSPSSRKMDYLTKVVVYEKVGVCDYWIVDPAKKSVVVYNFANDVSPSIYQFTDKIKANVFPDLEIDFSEISQ